MNEIINLEEMPEVMEFIQFCESKGIDASVECSRKYGGYVIRVPSLGELIVIKEKDPEKATEEINAALQGIENLILGPDRKSGPPDQKVSTTKYGQKETERIREIRAMKR